MIQDEAAAALSQLVRDEGRRLLATLVRTTGSWQLAEDAVQDAIERALVTWARDGLPDSPRAWLTTTARRRAIDVVRREAAREGKELEAVSLLEPDEPSPSVVRDDQLRLLFTCCHPALAREAQVALALRTLCGLSTHEVARALLVPEQVMAKRLTRAKDKIAKAGIPYRVPEPHDLPDRATAVANVIYLVFNEGYSATSGKDLMRESLADEAIRLARLFRELLPDDATATGLLALLLLQDSRRRTRVVSGELVLLRDQDRSRWDPQLLREGVALVAEGIRRTPLVPNRFVVEAALAGCHALARSWEATDWKAIIGWYDVLSTVHDTPVVRLNRAAAVAERDGPESGLADMDALAEDLAAYSLWHASRAELLRRLGRHDEARLARENAAKLSLNEVQRAFLDRG